MQIHQVKRNSPNQTRKRVGRGGKRGKTAGRGTKGQGARAGRKFRPELRDKIKKLPKLRGYRFKSRSAKPKVVTLISLDRTFPNGGEINPTTLFAHGLISRENGKLPEVKILGTGEVKGKFTVSLSQMSKVAQTAIEKAGGTVNTRAASLPPKPRVKKVAQIKKV